MTLKENNFQNSSTAPEAAASESQNGIIELTPTTVDGSPDDGIPFATATAMSDDVPQPMGVGPPVAYATGLPQPPANPPVVVTSPMTTHTTPTNYPPPRYGRNNDGSCTCCCITCIIVTVVIVCCVLPLVITLLVFAVAASAIGELDDDFFHEFGGNFTEVLTSINDTDVFNNGT